MDNKPTDWKTDIQISLGPLTRFHPSVPLMRQAPP